jgi:hypothetical protein
MVGVIDTGEHLIPSVNNTGDKHSISNNSVNFTKIWNVPIRIPRGPGETESWKKTRIRNRPFKGVQVWDFDVLDFNDFFIMKSL